MKRRRTVVLALIVVIVCLPGSPAGAWEKMLCLNEGHMWQGTLDGGFGKWAGHGNGSPVEIWYANRDLTTGNDATMRHIFDTAVKEWNGKIGNHASMVKVNIAGDNYAPGTSSTDFDFDSIDAGSDIVAGWFTAICDGPDAEDWDVHPRRWFQTGNDVRLNQTIMDEYFANDEYFMVAHTANHEIGHAFGLGHENDIPCDGKTVNSVMRDPTCEPYYTPGPDDWEGVRASYRLTTPNFPNPNCQEIIGSNCHIVLPPR